jgi:hypothetical protein
VSGVKFGKCVGFVACAAGVAAAGVMWGEAGLPAAGRPLHLGGGTGTDGIFGNKYPESLIAFVGLMWLTTLAGLLGLTARDDSPEWTWGPALILVGGLAVAMVWQARRVNGVPAEVVQPGYLAAVAAAAAQIGAGVVCLMPGRRRAYREVTAPRSRRSATPARSPGVRR